MATTIGVLTLLEGAARDEALRMWSWFETAHGARRVQSFAHPHVTYQAGICADVDELSDALVALCEQLPLLEISIDGLGWFDAASKVIFMKVRPTDELLAMHSAINDLVSRHCADVFDLYLPGNWEPHVTLAVGDLTDDAFEQAQRDLSDYHPQYRQVLSNVHLVRRDGETAHTEIVRSYGCGLACDGRADAAQGV